MAYHWSNVLHDVILYCAQNATITILLQLTKNIDTFRSRIQSRKPFITTSQYNFVTSARESSIPSDDPSSLNGHVTLINNTLDYGYGITVPGKLGDHSGQSRQELSDRPAKNMLLTNGITTTITTARSAVGDSCSSNSYVSHLPPICNNSSTSSGGLQHQLEGQNSKRTRSRSARPRIPGRQIFQGSKMIRQGLIN